MKHILNNLTKEEKDNILKQHSGGMKVMSENFNRLMNAKLGNVKPLINEQNVNKKLLDTKTGTVLQPGQKRYDGTVVPNTPKPVTPGLNYKALADTLDKSMRGIGTDKDLLISVLNQIKTPQDWTNLNNAFGTRDGQTLDQWFKGDIIDGTDYKNIIQAFYDRISNTDRGSVVGGASR
jgi:hypothetical protein